MTIDCPHCDATFSSKFNLNRHMDRRHIGEEDDDEEDNVTGESEPEEEGDEEEEKPSKNISTSNKDDGDMDEEERKKTEEELGINILKKAADDVIEQKPNMEDARKLLREPYFSMLLDAVQANVRKKLQNYNALSRSDIVCSVEGAKESFMNDDDYDSDEAEQRAWEARKYKVKNLLDENIDAIQKHIDEEEDEDDEEQDY